MLPKIAAINDVKTYSSLIKLLNLILVQFNVKWHFNSMENQFTKIS